MALIIVDRGFKTLVFTDAPDGPPPEVNLAPIPARFSATKVAAKDIPPSAVYEVTNGQLETLPVRPISVSKPPPK
jgi:hypothetical protein